MNKLVNDYLVYNKEGTFCMSIALSDKDFAFESLLNGRYARQSGKLLFINDTESEKCFYNSEVGHFIYDCGQVYFGNLYGYFKNVTPQDRILVPLDEFKDLVIKLWGQNN